jgi:hypothetical protein
MGGSIAAPTPVNIVGKAGQTVDGGGFTYTSSQSSVELLSNVTVTVSDPALLSSLTLTATFDESNPSVTVTPPTGTTVFTFSPPVSVPPNATITFSLSATIAGGGAATRLAPVLQTSFRGRDSDAGVSGGGFASGSAMRTIPGLLGRVFPANASSRDGFLMLLVALLPMLLMTFIFQGTVRQRMIAAGLAMFIATVTITGCDPCPSCVSTKLESTVQTLVAVTLTDGEGNQLSLTGIPVTLSQISK